MGNCLTKLCCRKASRTKYERKGSRKYQTTNVDKNSDEHVEIRQSNRVQRTTNLGQNQDERIEIQHSITTQRNQLETFFQHIFSTASLDFTSQEIKDIQDAVHTMLDRIRERVNERGVFDVSRIEPTGSMAEETSIWRLHGKEEPYLEFDYLAVLKASIRECEDQLRRNSCPGCIEIVNPPVAFERVQTKELEHYGKQTFEAARSGKKEINGCFMYEIHTCITSSCDCFVLNHVISNQNYHTFQPSSVDKKKGCDKCFVEMPTGTLSVNTKEVIEQFSFDLNNCSLILQWTSKTNSVLAPDKFLLQKHPVVSLPIYIDFLPAVESLKLPPSGDEYEHDFFIVPKRCNCCLAGFEYRWRKSWCMAEIRTFHTEMSTKHRRCYQITKYLTSLIEPIPLDKYMIKNVVLQHSIECSDTTDDCADCVVQVYRDILHAYNLEKFLSYHSNLRIGILEPFLQANKAYFQRLLTELCSVSETDTWDSFVLNLIQMVDY